MSRDRDRILEQALKHELRREGAATPACLDAETLAAWQDGALDAARMSVVETHASTCTRCQAMLAAFARGTATPAVETVPDADGFRWWKWWLAPLAAGAAAVTLWMVVPEEQKLATAPPQPQTSVAIDATQSRAAEQARPPLAPPGSQEIERKRDAADSKLNVEAAREDRQQFKDAPAPKEETAVTQMAPPPATVALGAAAPAARNEGFAAAPSADLQKSARLSVASTEVATLDRNYRWRITGNRIELTANAGSTWTVVRDQPNEGISAGSAPTPSVAWFVGRAGLVLVTKDGGASFDEVSIAEPLDIASVSAVDARTASIFTTSGRRFRTDDGGRSWRPF